MIQNLMVFILVLGGAQLATGTSFPELVISNPYNTTVDIYIAGESRTIQANSNIRLRGNGVYRTSIETHFPDKGIGYRRSYSLHEGYQYFAIYNKQLKRWVFEEASASGTKSLSAKEKKFSLESSKLLENQREETA